MFSKKPVYYANTAYERRNFNSKNLTTTGLNAAEITEFKNNHAKDLNIDDRIELFQDQISEEIEFLLGIFLTLENQFSDQNRL